MRSWRREPGLYVTMQSLEKFEKPEHENDEADENTTAFYFAETNTVLLSNHRSSILRLGIRRRDAVASSRTRLRILVPRETEEK